MKQQTRPRPQRGLIATLRRLTPPLLAGTVAALQAATVTYSQPGENQFLKRWTALGPIPLRPGAQPLNDTQQEQAFHLDLLAHQGGEARLDPAAAEIVEIQGRSFPWRTIESSQDLVDLGALLGQGDDVTAFAAALIEVPAAKTLLMGVGSDDAIKLWLNGEPIHEHWAGRPARKDDDLVELHLKPGANLLLARVQNREGPWGFVCRQIAGPVLTKKLQADSQTGRINRIRLLLKYGADPEVPNAYGLSSIGLARVNGYRKAAALLLAHSGPAAPKIPAPAQLADAFLRSRIPSNQSGAAALVSRGGKVLFQHGYGLASIEYQVPVTARTRFKIGSITKQFTASAILKLVENGKLALDDRLSKFVPDFPRAGEVTLRHLLNHTSGIKNYTSKPEFAESARLHRDTVEVIQSLERDPYDFPPGEKWQYNNSGYILLGHIIETISGKSLGDFLNDAFFGPLGMEHTGIHDLHGIYPNLATGYAYGGLFPGESHEPRLHRAAVWDLSWAGGAGALYSTVEDLYRWNEALFGGRVLSAQSLKRAFTPAVTQEDIRSGIQEKDEGYGCGWAISRHRGLRVIEHSGGLEGFTSHLARYPEKNLTVAVLANMGPPLPGAAPADLSRQLAQFYLWQEMPSRDLAPPAKAASAERLRDYVGKYDYKTAILTVTREKEHLYAQLTTQPRLELFEKEPDVFVWKVVDARIQFIRDPEGQVTEAVHSQGGISFHAARLQEKPAIQVGPSVLRDYVGKYDYGLAGTLAVTQDGARLFAQMSGQPRFEIFPESQTRFFWKVVHATVEFIRDEHGKVTRAIHSQAGATIHANKIQ